MLHLIEPEILPSGAFIFTPLELTVIALARREKGRRFGSGRHLAQALFQKDQLLPGGRENGTLADPRLEVLRAFVKILDRRGQRLAAATQILREAGFSSLQETWLRSECARPL